MNNLVNTNPSDENTTTSSSVINNPIFKLKSISLFNNSPSGSRIETYADFDEQPRNIEGKTVLIKRKNGKSFYAIVVKTQKDSQSRIKSYLVRSKKSKKIYIIAPENIHIIDSTQTEGGSGLSDGLDKILNYNDWESKVHKKKERLKQPNEY